MSQQEINQKAIKDNQSFNFKTTADNCKETKLVAVVGSGTHTIIDLIAAERYDAMIWLKAREEYLERENAKLQKATEELKKKMKYLKLNDWKMFREVEEYYNDPALNSSEDEEEEDEE
jgi:hypothetical protein